jgi:hypothetical protein
VRPRELADALENLLALDQPVKIESVGRIGRVRRMDM